MNRTVYILILLSLVCSCKRAYKQNKSDDTVEVIDNVSTLQLTKWRVTGPFPLCKDSIVREIMLSSSFYPEGKECRDTTITFWHNGIYHPQYGQLDLREVYGISVADTTKKLDSLVNYFSCILCTKKTRRMFLLVNTNMACRQYLNGDTLKAGGYDNIAVYPVYLSSGQNKLLVQATKGDGNYWYDAMLLDSAAFVHNYMEKYTGNIIRPIIKGNIAILTDRHWSISEKPIKMSFHDVKGKLVKEILLSNDSMRINVDGLCNNRAYICSMSLGNESIRQPVMTWDAHLALENFSLLYDSLPGNHSRKAEIGQLLFRLRKLFSVSDKMKSDSWYPFKIPWVVYQIEHVFAHLDGTYGNDDGEYNFKFITYRSNLDNGIQRYILVTPNHVDINKKYPLVVVVRPSCEKRHHLFFCPQIAHQWVVNDVQAVANSYQCFVMMPEARMVLNEDLTPFAETEMLLAISDVKDHYNIDENRVYLHANCSGGRRALKLSTHYPELFAAMALYAPVYKKDNSKSIYDDSFNDERLKIENLKNVPTLIFGDPADTHSPMSNYEMLAKEFQELNVPYQLTLRRNSGQGYYGYHRLLVGREACDFFQDKIRKSDTSQNITKQGNIPDIKGFYSRPFVYVYNASDTSKVYCEFVKAIRKEYNRYFYSELPLVPDTRVTRKTLVDNNLFLIGNRYKSLLICKLLEKLSICADNGLHKEHMSLIPARNPYNDNGIILVYTSGYGKKYQHLISCPWKE